MPHSRRRSSIIVSSLSRRASPGNVDGAVVGVGSYVYANAIQRQWVPLVSRRRGGNQQSILATVCNDVPNEINGSLCDVPTCLEYGFHSFQYCKRCTESAATLGIDIAEREPDTLRSNEVKIANRSQTHGKTRKLQC